MNEEKNNLVEKKCGNQACGCADNKKVPEKKPEEKTDLKKTELDPTHFGDWQVNCRAIDF